MPLILFVQMQILARLFVMSDQLLKIGIVHLARGHQGHFAQREKAVDDGEENDEQNFDDHCRGAELMLIVPSLAGLRET